MTTIHVINPTVQVRQARLEDHESIMALAARYGLTTRSYDEWRHLWEGNPALEHWTHSWPIGWVLETGGINATGTKATGTKAGGPKIVGFIGNIPLEYTLEGRTLMAAALTSTVIDKGYRRISDEHFPRAALKLLEAFYHQPHVDLVMSSTASAAQEKNHAYFGARRVPAASYDEARLRITRYRGFARSVAEMKAMPKKGAATIPKKGAATIPKKGGATMPKKGGATSLLRTAAPFLRAAAPVLALGLRGSDLLLRRNPCPVPFCGTIRTVASFDADFDTFWEELKRRYPTTLMRVRDRRHLSWHFKYPLSRGRTWILVAEKASRMVGYAIFLRNDVANVGLKRMSIVDLQTIDDSPESPDTMAALLSAGVTKSRGAGIHVVEAIGFNRAKRAVVEQLCPHSRKLPSWRFYYHAAEDGLAAILQRPDIWDPCTLDGDSTL